MEASTVTGGKLVRDLIPNLIRNSGRRAEVRHLTGQALVAALAAKLCEEAQEVSEAVGSREHLIEELADLRQVISALMTVCGISDQEVTGVAVAKAEELGAFDSGAWLVSPELEH
jgi:predicted house-cleaning noncanonical NTP pyrophosphatase (MazG superfamily)